MATRWGRTLRGSLTAVIAVFLAAVSHSAGGRVAPGGVGVAIALAFAVVICVAFAGRRLSLVRLAASVGISQLLFHFLFSLGGGSAQSIPAVITTHHSAIPDTSTGSLPVTTALLGTTTHTGHGDGWMWLAHALAAAVTIAALHRGEATIVALATVAASRFSVAVLALAGLRSGYGTVPIPRIPVAAEFIPVTESAVLSSLRHRGPPRPGPLYRTSVARRSLRMIRTVVVSPGTPRSFANA